MRQQRISQHSDGVLLEEAKEKMRTSENTYRVRLTPLHFCLAVTLAMTSATTAFSQTDNDRTTQQTTGTRSKNAGQTTAIGTPDPGYRSTQEDRIYRLGPGDVIEIRVFNRPQLSRDAVRIDERGVIRIPLIEDELRASCRTVAELAAEITTRYAKYLRNPQVDVFIKEYQSQPVAVIGAVKNSQRFQLQRRVRLLELLTFAGGPGERAGRIIHVIHSNSASFSCGPDEEDNQRLMQMEVVSYDLAATLKGEESANPYILPGDVVTVPEAEQVFVVGNVLRPGPLTVREAITVTQAIARVGGALSDTKSDRVRIVRQGSEGRSEIYVDLKKINKREAEDLALQANDIVEVPTASGKRFLRTLSGAVVPTVSRLPVAVIN